MTSYDMCLAWNWEYDAEFVHLLENACSSQNKVLVKVTPNNLDSMLRAMQSGEVRAKSFLDRASDTDPRFIPLSEYARGNGAYIINPQKQVFWTHDKASLHREFLTQGLEVPFTIILPSHNEQNSPTTPDLNPFHDNFVLKPAHGGGGEGVVLDANCWDQVLEIRMQFPDEKYLLQECISPKLLDRRPGWFRILYCDGGVYPCWWDQNSHVYIAVSAEESAYWGLRMLREIPRRIAGMCGLDLFSTEVALTDEDKFIIVDYVNDPVDLRPQSSAADGVPDNIIINIIHRLLRMTG